MNEGMFYRIHGSKLNTSRITFCITTNFKKESRQICFVLFYRQIIIPMHCCLAQPEKRFQTAVMTTRWEDLRQSAVFLKVTLKTLPNFCASVAMLEPRSLNA